MAGRPLLSLGTNYEKNNSLTHILDRTALGHDKAQDLIDQITKMYEGGHQPNRPFPNAPTGMGGPGQPGFAPPPGMGGPPPMMMGGPPGMGAPGVSTYSLLWPLYCRGETDDVFLVNSKSEDWIRWTSRLTITASSLWPEWSSTSRRGPTSTRIHGSSSWLCSASRLRSPSRYVFTPLSTNVPFLSHQDLPY